MRVHQNTWGRVSQAWKSGYGIDELVHVLQLGLSDLIGGDVGRCIGGPSRTLLHMHKVFPARRGKQMIVMSISDVTVIVLM